MTKAIILIAKLTATDRPTTEYLAHHGRLAPGKFSPLFDVVAGLAVDGPALVAPIALSGSRGLLFSSLFVCMHAGWVTEYKVAHSMVVALVLLVY